MGICLKIYEGTPGGIPAWTIKRYYARLSRGIPEEIPEDIHLWAFNRIPGKFFEGVPGGVRWGIHVRFFLLKRF